METNNDLDIPSDANRAILDISELSGIEHAQSETEYSDDEFLDKQLETLDKTMNATDIAGIDKNDRDGVESFEPVTAAEIAASNSFSETSPLDVDQNVAVEYADNVANDESFDIENDTNVNLLTPTSDRMLDSSLITSTIFEHQDCIDVSISAPNDQLELASIKNINDELISINTELHKRLTDNDEVVSKLNSEIESYKDEIDDLKSRINELTLQVSDRTAMVNMWRQIEDIRQLVQTRFATVDSGMNTLYDKLTVVDDIDYRCKTIDTNIASIDKNMIDIINQVGELHTNINKTSKSVTSATSEINETLQSFVVPPLNLSTSFSSLTREPSRSDLYSEESKKILDQINTYIRLLCQELRDKHNLVKAPIITENIDSGISIIIQIKMLIRNKGVTPPEPQDNRGRYSLWHYRVLIGEYLSKYGDATIINILYSSKASQRNLDIAKRFIETKPQLTNPQEAYGIYATIKQAIQEWNEKV